MDLHKSGLALLHYTILAISLGFVGNATFATAQDVRIDVTPDARVRIENQFGGIVATVWKENYVSVAVTIEESGAPFTSSPIVIENKSRLLLISVVRRPLDPKVSIRLTVKLPEGANAEINTGAGPIAIHGLPASASLKSASGDIFAEMSRPLNAEINVRSGTGAVRSSLAEPLTAGGHVLQARVGTGERVLKINTIAGVVTLGFMEPGAGTITDTEPPRLSGTETNPKGAGTPATKSASEEVSEGDVIRVDSQLAALNVSVIDRTTNRGLVGLTQRDFTLFEDGVQQDIVQFESAAAPFDLILLIDVSGSTRDVVKLIRAAALRFVDAARPSDRIAIVSFAGEPKLVSPLTLDRDVLRRRVQSIDTALGDTKLYDALDFALKLRDTNNSRRTAVVLMSDGLDGSIPGVQGDGSRLTYNELLTGVREFDGVLYALWLNTEYEAMSPLDTQPEAFDKGYDRTKELADAGGGS
ncbi:MAG: VWA domain-containing protein, partial [Acidobacteriota bacterium]